MSRRELQELMNKAVRSLAAADLLIQKEHYDFAVSRSYYAMFYAAQALLLTRDIRRTKHSAIIAAFNEHFIHTGELPHELFLSLRTAFEDRAEGDYGLAVISAEQADGSLAAAREFVDRVSAKVASWLADRS
jgi:uncharacterized protein (UPF0332 family)